jgi:hypothetical protein
VRERDDVAAVFIRGFKKATPDGKLAHHAPGAAEHMLVPERVKAGANTFVFIVVSRGSRVCAPVASLVLIVVFKKRHAPLVGRKHRTRADFENAAAAGARPDASRGDGDEKQKGENNSNTVPKVAQKNFWESATLLTQLPYQK